MPGLPAMGDVKKVISKPLKYLLPVVGALLGAGVGGFGFFGLNAVQGYLLGSALAGLGNKQKLSEGTTASPTYSFGPRQNTLSDMLPVPIVYGRMKLNGNIIWARDKGSSERDMAVALCQGEVQSVSDIRLDNRPVTDFTGCTATGQTGASDQALDARMDGWYKGSTKRIALAAVTITASEQLTGNPVVSAVVEGKKIKVYDGSWTTEYSNNAAWVIRDLLTTVALVPEALIDDVSFYAFAQRCDDEPTGEYDRGLNVATEGTCSGGIEPEKGNDGSYSTAIQGWYVDTGAQDETMALLGKIDIGRSVYMDLIKLHLWAGDDRTFYNYKVAVSTDDVTYTTVVDRTGSGIDYQGVQYIDFTARNAQYIKIYGSGSSISTHFVITEAEVFELVQAKRYTLNGVIDSELPVRDVLRDMLEACCATMVFSDGMYKIIEDMHKASVESYDTTNIVRDSLSWSKLPRTDKVNRVVIHWVNPTKNWLRDQAVDNDTLDQTETGEVRKREMSVLWCTSRSLAARLARRAGNIARQVEWVGELRGGYGGLALEQGDIVDVTDAKQGWTGKSFKITNITELPNMQRNIAVQEHISSIYSDQGGVTYSPTDSSTLPDPGAQPRHCMDLALSEDKQQHTDGSWVPQINGTFTRPSGGAPWGYADVELSTDGGSTYWVVGRAKATSATAGIFQIKNLKAGIEYYVRLVSVSQAGIKASSTTAPYSSITLVGKASAPGNVDGFNFSVSRKTINLVWNTAYDANKDLSHYIIKDGVSWADGTELVRAGGDTTRKSFQPTKRAYQLWIKAFDRTGNESAAATELVIAIAAPQVAGSPTLMAAPPTNILCDFLCLENVGVWRYDIHASTTGPAFTPSASTLVTTASPGYGGHGAGMFAATAGTRYYVQVCAIDDLSDVVGDQYDYPSGESNMLAHYIKSEHLSPTGIVMMPDGVGGAPYIRVFDGSDYVAYLGQIDDGGNDRWGLWTEDYIHVGPAAAPLIKLESGIGYLSRGLVIGDETSTDAPLSTAENAGNLLANGGFEQITTTGYTTVIPGWTVTEAGGTNLCYVLPLETFGDVTRFAKGSRYAVQIKASATVTCELASAYIPVRPGELFQFSGYFRSIRGVGVPYVASVRTFTEAKAAVGTVALLSETLSSTTMTRKSASFTIPATVYFIRIKIYTTAMASDYDYLNVDSCQVEPGNVVTAFCEAPLIGGHFPTAMALTPDTGIQIYSSGAERFRAGNIGGLSDGAGGTVAANTMGIWNKGGFYFLDAAGNAMFTASGLESDAFIAGTIAKTILDTATQEILQSDGNSDADRPHDYHIAFVASGTTAKSATLPHTVAHGQANAPLVVAFVRGYDSGTSAYSKWMQIPGHVSYTYRPSSTEAHWYHADFWVTADTTNIKFGCYLTYMRFGDYCDAAFNSEFNSTYKSYLVLQNTSDAWVNIWDELQFAYLILREGV